MNGGWAREELARLAGAMIDVVLHPVSKLERVDLVGDPERPRRDGPLSVRERRVRDHLPHLLVVEAKGATR
jgi:hypothetical protein